jgi:hypothetical protein
MRRSLLHDFITLPFHSTRTTKARPVCRDLHLQSFLSLRVGEEVEERSVVHKAKRAPVAVLSLWRRTSPQAANPVGARGRMLISADLFVSLLPPWLSFHSRMHAIPDTVHFYDRYIRTSATGSLIIYHCKRKPRCKQRA